MKIGVLPFADLTYEDLRDIVISAPAGRTKTIAFSNMNTIAIALRDPEFLRTMHIFDVIVPDGASVIFASALKNGFRNRLRRLPGPDFMYRFLKEDSLHRHFFMGSSEAVLHRLETSLLKMNRSIKIAGMLSPPFKEHYNDEELVYMNKKIEESCPDVVWVGLGCPKQERWISYSRDKISVKAVLGVGAAFDFISGSIRRAPKGLRVIGAEFLYRLIRQPKKTAPRVFVDPFVILLKLIDKKVSNGRKSKN